MSKVIIVSSDSHAAMPTDLWPQYVERRYHELLPQVQQEDELNREVLWMFNNLRLSPDYDVFDREQLFRSGRYAGLWDPQIRLEELDRDGVAAEVVHHGDFRIMDVFHNIMGGEYPLDVWDAGARAYDRWAADTFGRWDDRFLLVSAIGSCADMDAALAQLDWIADHGFVGTYAPGYMRYRGMPELTDDSWTPFWARCEEHGLVVVLHAGYGNEQGFIHREMQRCYRETKGRGGTDQDLLAALTGGIFNQEFFTDVKPRRAMAQLMLSGVFDRHPGLKVALTENRADWLPVTLRHLDARYAEHREDLPARRPPSEYWPTNWLAGLSFIHRAEVEMRDEIGIETMVFGRDYPHTEGTWPNTREFMAVAFEGVPDDEVRLMLGENAVRFFDLDRAELAEVAERVGPDVGEINGRAAAVDPALVEHLTRRSGLLKAAEGDARLAATDAMVREDLVAAGVHV